MINNWICFKPKPFSRPAGMNLFLYILSHYDVDIQIYRDELESPYLRIADRDSSRPSERVLPEIQAEIETKFKLVPGACPLCEGDEETRYDCPHKTYTSV